MTERTPVLPTMGFEYWRGSIANSNRAPREEAYVTHAFCWEECFQGAPLSPPQRESKALAPLQHAPASCSPRYRAWYSAVWCQFGLVCFGSIQLLPKNAISGHSCMCVEEEVKTGLGEFLFRRNSCWAVVHKEPKSIFSGNYHKRNEILLHQLLS